MKQLPIFFIMFTSLEAFSDTDSRLCQDRKSSIEPDMQMAETIFSQSYAKDAEVALKKLDVNTGDKSEQFQIKNNEKIIVGYQLKKRALKSMKQSDIKVFCDFYVSEAYYHD